MSASRDTPARSILSFSASGGSAGELVRRRRTWHLPSDGAPLTPNGQSAQNVVSEFVDHLAELPLIEWLALGRDLSGDDSLSLRRSAWIDVERAIAAHRLEIAAWYVRDAIETAVCLASRQTSRWSREERCHFASAHGAAEVAALALLARQLISSDSLRVLCAPFRRQFENP